MTNSHFYKKIRSRLSGYAAWARSFLPQMHRAGRIRRFQNFVWLLNSEPAYLAPKLECSPIPDVPGDADLVGRVMRSFRRADEDYSPSQSFWDEWNFSLKKDIYDALRGSDIEAAGRYLRKPSENVFFWGFDAISRSPEGLEEPHVAVLTRLNSAARWETLYSYWLVTAMESFSQMIGASRIRNPEAHGAGKWFPRESVFPVDQAIDAIESSIGKPLVFPNPFAGELGLKSKRGIIGFRALQSLYQGWRIHQLSRNRPDFKVLEIGAGLGRTAFYASYFGVPDYTVIDIPLTNAAQAYFLGRVVGEDKVGMFGEEAARPIRVYPQSYFFDAHADRYDLVVNVDSLTEMSRETAQAYWDRIRKKTNAFLSINHELNSHTVRELYSGAGDVVATRYPYPMRRGYVEELVVWK